MDRTFSLTSSFKESIKSVIFYRKDKFLSLPNWSQKGAQNLPLVFYESSGLDHLVKLQHYTPISKDGGCCFGKINGGGEDVGMVAIQAMTG